MKNWEISHQDSMRKNLDAVDMLPLAMAYVPFQRYENIYEPNEALCRGTIFADLDKPFCGMFTAGDRK